MTLDNHLKIKDLPESERPYEKLEKYGAERLTDAELLAIIIKTGTKKETSVSLAQRILGKAQRVVSGMNDISLQELTNISGIGRVKAIQIKAVLELGKRFVSYKKCDKIYIKTPNDVADYLMEDMRTLNKEHVKGILLNTKNQLIKIIDISIGSLNSSIVHPREVFSEAIKCSAASLIVVHNHPSGDCTPSSEDISITKRLHSAGQILGVELVDHIIIGDQKYTSLKEINIF